MIEPDARLLVELEGGAVAQLRRYARAGATRLFLSHGNGFAIDGYRRFWEPLADQFELVVYDQRNHGHSAHSAAAGHHFGQMSDDLQKILQAVNAHWGRQPGVGVYHSLSARVALIHLQEYGWQWDALVLFDPPTVPPEGAAREAMLKLDVRLAEWSANRQETFDHPQELADQLRDTRAHAHWERGAHEEMARAVLRERDSRWQLVCPRELETEIYRSNRKLDLWPDGKHHREGILLVGADPRCEHPSPTALSNAELARAGDYHYVVVENSGHLLQLERSAACRAALQVFLAERGLA